MLQKRIRNKFLKRQLFLFKLNFTFQDDDEEEDEESIVEKRSAPDANHNNRENAKIES